VYVPEVILRPVVPTDFDDLRRCAANWGDKFEFFGFRPANSLEREYAANGCLSDDDGMLVVDLGGEPIGQVHWFPAHYGPQSASKALRLGIALPRHAARVMVRLPNGCSRSTCSRQPM
jgi:hypothetical protein